MVVSGGSGGCQDDERSCGDACDWRLALKPREVGVYRHAHKKCYTDLWCGEVWCECEVLLISGEKDKVRAGGLAERKGKERREEGRMFGWSMGEEGKEQGEGEGEQGVERASGRAASEEEIERDSKEARERAS